MGNYKTRLVAERVNASRDSLGLSVNELAVATGIPRTTLQRKLGGQNDFTVGELFSIADHMNLDWLAWLRDLPKVA